MTGILCEFGPNMLLANIAPHFGLFNGAITYFKGFLYLPDNLIVKLRACELRDLGIQNRIVQKSIELRGANFQSRFHILPKGSIVIAMNDTLVSCDGDMASYLQGDESVKCELLVSKKPPSVPDFVVVQVPEYAERGGVNILG